MAIFLSDTDLLDLQTLLALACGRSHTATKGKARTKACFLFTTLDIERAARGLPAPSPPWSASNLHGPQPA